MDAKVGILAISRTCGGSRSLVYISRAIGGRLHPRLFSLSLTQTESTPENLYYWL